MKTKCNWFFDRFTKYYLSEFFNARINENRERGSSRFLSFVELSKDNPRDILKYYQCDRVESHAPLNLVSTILEIGPRSRSEKCLANKIAAFP